MRVFKSTIKYFPLYGTKYKEWTQTKAKPTNTFSHYKCFDKCPPKELLPTLIYEKKEKAAYSAANSSSSLTLEENDMNVSGVITLAVVTPLAFQPVTLT